MMDSSGTMPEFARRLDDDAAARQALADIVVAFAFEVEGDAACQPRAERLARGALQADLDGVVRQAGMAVDLGHRARQHRAGRAVGVVDLVLDLDRRAAVERGLRLLDQAAVEHLLQMMVLRLGVVDLLALGFLLPCTNSFEKSSPLAFQCATSVDWSSIWVWPTISSNLRIAQLRP